MRLVCVFLHTLIRSRVIHIGEGSWEQQVVQAGYRPYKHC